MKVTLWGTRGSLASPGPETTRFGGNTACVAVRGPEGTLLVLDAGTGIRRLGATLPASLARVDVLLTHLHLDHIQGLGFFAPIYAPDTEVHLWGPASTTLPLRPRLERYLSPPLFPVRLRDLPCPERIFFHEVAEKDFVIGEFRVHASLVCHPGPTVGYRVSTDTATLAYLPDHEPALGARDFPQQREWTSGYRVAARADLLIHDAQYDSAEYAAHVGWGHSSWRQALAFAALTDVRRLVAFHHDPDRSDNDLERLSLEAEVTATAIPATAAVEGETFDLA